MVLRTLTCAAVLLATAAAPAQAFLAGQPGGPGSKGAYTDQRSNGGRSVPPAKNLGSGNYKNPYEKYWDLLPGDSQEVKSGGTNGSTAAGTSEHDRSQARVGGPI